MIFAAELAFIAMAFALSMLITAWALLLLADVITIVRKGFP